MFLGHEKFKQDNVMSAELTKIHSNIQFNYFYLSETFSQASPHIHLCRTFLLMTANLRVILSEAHLVVSHMK